MANAGMLNLRLYLYVDDAHHAEVLMFQDMSVIHAPTWHILTQQQTHGLALDYVDRILPREIGRLSHLGRIRST